MTALTRELERTRNGAKVMERTLDAAAAEIARLREDYADSQDQVKALEAALRPFAKEFKDWDGVGCWDEMTLEDMYGHAPGESAGIKFSDIRRAAALLEKK